jgi:hypothetical protein
MVRCLLSLMVALRTIALRSIQQQRLGCTSLLQVLMVSNYTELRASLRQYTRLAGSTGLVLQVSQDIELGAALEVSGAQSIIVRGATPTGRLPVLSCRPSSAAFNLLGYALTQRVWKRRRLDPFAGRHVQQHSQGTLIICEVAL